jgi:hypothetical protein
MSRKRRTVDGLCLVLAALLLLFVGSSMLPSHGGHASASDPAVMAEQATGPS